MPSLWELLLQGPQFQLQQQLHLPSSITLTLRVLVVFSLMVMWVKPGLEAPTSLFPHLPPISLSAVHISIVPPNHYSTRLRQVCLKNLAVLGKIHPAPLNIGCAFNPMLMSNLAWTPFFTSQILTGPQKLFSSTATTRDGLRWNHGLIVCSLESFIHRRVTYPPAPRIDRILNILLHFWRHLSPQSSAQNLRLPLVWMQLVLRSWSPSLKGNYPSKHLFRGS